jgi:peptidoglycan/LPS O-acetylase OafA/YrhL
MCIDSIARTRGLRFFTAGFDLLFNRGLTTIFGLDALRSLAILLVFSGHSYAHFKDAIHAELPIGQFPLIHFGWAGVDLFFVLSGYLIGRALWKELTQTGSIHIGEFLVRRGLRIWPYYYLVVVVTAAWLLPGTWHDFFPDVFFLSNYFPNQVEGGWSLSTEEQFYIALPLLLLATHRFIRFSRYWVMLLVLFALPIFARVFALRNLGHHLHTDPAMFRLTYTPIQTHCDGLIAGLTLSWLSVARPSFVAPRTFLRNAPIPVLCVALGCVLRMVNPDYFAFTGLALIFGATTLFILRDQSILRWITGARVFHTLSRLSFGMYLNHIFVLGYLTPVLCKFGFAADYLGNLAVSIAIAALTFVLVEAPFLELRDSLLARESRVKHA